MLKVENISTGYGKKQILFDVSFEVKQGEIVLLAGSNGSGKSTMLKAIYGLLPVWNSGKIIFNEENITGRDASDLLNKGLLYIPQKNNLFPDLSVKENLEMAGLILGDKLLKKRIEGTLSMFTSLRHILKRTPMKLSGGERQLLTLAMANLHQPKMLMVDEPFTGLSFKNLTFVLQNLILLKETGVTLIIIEHRVNECLEIVNKVVGLKLGKVFSLTEVGQGFNVSQLHQLFV